nr:EOG090X0J8E [Lepidurus arcticus]
MLPDETFFECSQHFKFASDKDVEHFRVINQYLLIISGCLYYFAATINPILYNVMSVRYREAFKETLCGEKSKYGYGSSFQRTASERRHDVWKQADFTMLKNIQGIHAPLRLHMEQRAVSRIGHLPFLPRHNALLDALTGNDLNIDFDDVLCNPAESEVMGQPHAMMEKLHGLL